MASGGASGTSKAADDKFSCPICMEIFVQPTEIPCGHSFCKDCINSCIKDKSQVPCPICRLKFSSHQMINNFHLATLMQTTNRPCPDCKKSFLISSLKDHYIVCIKRGSCSFGKVPSVKPVVTTSQLPPSIPNRSTFKCPYCSKANLDIESLVEHTNAKHRQETMQVVCPVCASMPWGSAHQKSVNYVQHLNIRHKFDYERYVDFDQDEEKVLQDVIAMSMNEK